MIRSLLLILFLGVADYAEAQEWSVRWWSVDGGGEIATTDDPVDPQWHVSGSLGQPDASEQAPLEGGPWEVVGGFWPATVTETDVIFRDQFES